MKHLAIIVFLILSLPVSGAGQTGNSIIAERVVTETEVFSIVSVAENLENPWALAFLPDGSILITERPGRLQRIYPDGRRQEISGLPRIHSAGQGGLLDIAVHPDFSRNRLIYFTYAAPGQGGSSTALARAKLSESRLTDLEILWVMEKRTGGSNHYGSRILFAPDGTIYMTTGERGSPERARDPRDSAGKVLRFLDDGSIPADNPFRNRSGYLPEIYSLGHRNAQGLALRPGTGQIWLTEHGPRGGDELNLVKAGADYGWPLTTYGVAYSGARIAESPTAPGIEPPVYYWTPSIAPSGLAFYNGPVFPSWKGNLLSGALAGRRLVRLALEGNTVIKEEVLIQDRIGRIRDVRVGPEGYVYILTDDARGRLLVLKN